MKPKPAKISKRKSLKNFSRFSLIKNLIQPSWKIDLHMVPVHENKQPSFKDYSLIMKKKLESWIHEWANLDR